jgi:demethylmenaquinone methyltransferase/2-methoxy-6-polyprenyl-1,4-benzoquinol methylase
MSEKVQKMFANIAKDYDKMNDILSFGIHRLWRRITVKNAELKPDFKILDCATGTGDLAFAFKKSINKISNSPQNSEVIGTDFCEDMLVLARQKAIEKGIDVKFEFADVMDLQYADNYFDIASISFGIRNVDDPKRGISELARVVKSGGKVLILEFGQPFGILAPFYKFYSRKIMPFLGNLIAGDKGAYTYLPETAAKFPAGNMFLNIMQSTDNFSETKYIPLSSGIAYLYIGIVK